MPAARHIANGDERSAISYAFSFTKGLPHDYESGLVERVSDFYRFVKASDSGDRDAFRDVPLGPRRGFRTVGEEARLRGWTTQCAGLAFNLVGPDPQCLTMPPAPKAGSDELTAEMAEVYAQALLRDRPLGTFRHDAQPNAPRDQALQALGELPWFNGQLAMDTLEPQVQARRRTNLRPQTAFRGAAPGDLDGPYISQLLLVGSPGPDRTPADGIIQYGAQTIDQRVRYVEPRDFMTSWDEWIDVQDGLSPSQGELDTGSRRFITTGRDLATYVHSDALYQPYLNAALALLSNGFGLDRSLPFQEDDAEDHQSGFVLYGAPHVLSMLVEVCNRALKTVFFQKFNVHRRLRPEALAARVEKTDLLGFEELDQMASTLRASTIGAEIQRLNAGSSGTESMLLPMAYSEGSPMHPSYGAGHATVAGACVTVLKTLFDHTRRFDVAGDPSKAYVPTTDGERLAVVDVFDANGATTELTVEGELNKLAANISIGRDWAGVHYYSDYWESVLLGEQLAMQIMREHVLTWPEQVNLRVPTFEGGRVWL